MKLSQSVLIQVHGVDAEGGTVIRRQLRRRYVLSFLNKQPSCLVGIEACAVHTWLRSEVPAFLIDVRYSPNNRHSSDDVFFRRVYVRSCNYIGHCLRPPECRLMTHRRHSAPQTCALGECKLLPQCASGRERASGRGTRPTEACGDPGGRRCRL